MVKVGVLALQGAVIEHIRSIEASGAEAVVVVKSVNDLAEVDGLILPGGESTAMRKLIDHNGMLAALASICSRRKANVWDMCRLNIVSKGFSRLS